MRISLYYISPSTNTKIYFSIFLSLTVEVLCCIIFSEWIFVGLGCQLGPTRDVMAINLHEDIIDFYKIEFSKIIVIMKLILCAAF